MGVQLAGNILVQSNGGPIPIALGGTGQTTAPTAINALLPAQAGQAGKLLVTNGTNVSWMSGAITPGGADTQIQFNDGGTFGGSAKFVINKSTGALTSTSTLTNTGISISNADVLNRTLRFQTSGVDRWLMQANSMTETGASSGSDFEFVRIADNGLTSNIVYSINRATGVVDFAVEPTVNGGVIGGVTSFNTRQGAITLTLSDVTTALTFTPYNATNPAGYISSISGSDVTNALGFTPYNSTNPDGYTTNTGTVTSVVGTGTVSGLTLSGTVTSTGSLTLSGALSLTSAQVTTALGFTPYNNSNPSGYTTNTGTVTSVAASGSNGITVSGSPVTTSGTISLSLGNITPTSVVATGTVAGSNLSGTNTGDQTIALTGDVTGSGTGSFAATLATVNSDVGTYGSATQIPQVTVNGKGLVTAVTTTSVSIPSGAISVTGGDITMSGTTGTAITNATLATVNASPVTASFQKITTNGKGLVTATTAVTTGDITTALGYTPVNTAGDTITGTLTFSAGTVTGLTSPTSGTDATTKNYVDAAVAGLSWKTSVRAATTANITLSGTQTVDGIALVAGNRILVKNQTTQSQNGIYVVAASAWTRATDSATAAQLDGEAVYVQVGTTQADTGWTETATVVTVGTDPIVYAQFSGSGTYVAGTGLSLTGNTFANTGVTSVSAGSNISVSGATGAVTIAVTGTVPTATSATTATNIAAGVAMQVPFQSAASTTVFSDGLTYDDASRQFQVGTGVDSYGLILGGSNSIWQPAGVSSSLLIRASTGNAIRLYTDPGTGGTRGGDIRFYGGDSDTGQAANILLQTGVSGDQTLSGYIKANGAIGYKTTDIAASGAVTLAFADDGTNYTCTLSGNTTFSFVNAISGYWTNIAMQIAPNPSNYTITWPASVSWVTGSAPVISATVYTFVTLVTVDSGTTYLGYTVGGPSFGGSANALTGTTLASNVVSSSLTSVGTLTNLTVTNPISGSVTGNAGTVTNGVYTTGTSVVTNTMLAGSIANVKLVNSSITVNGTAIALGASGTVTAAAGTLTGTALNSTVVSSSLTSVGTITTGVWNGTAIANANLANAAVANLSGTNTGDNAANSTYASDYRAANFVAGTNYLAPTGNGSGLTSLTGANVTGTVASATTATNIAAGSAGNLHYQSAPGTTSFVTNGTTGQVLTSNGSSAPTWAPAPAGGLAITSVKTSAYTAAVNDLVRTDSTTAPFTVTLPASPADGDKVGLVDITNKCSINAVLIAASGGHTVEFDATGLSINVSGSAINLMYNSYNTNWKLI
jgi:hypothetical protein